MRSRALWTAGVVLFCVISVVGFGRLTRPGNDHKPSDPSASTHPATTLPSRPPSPSSKAGAGGGDSVSAVLPTLHYISNTGPDISGAARLGYNLFDTSPDKSRIDSLGPGQQALVWLGNLDNTDCTPGYSWTEFQAAVRNLAHDPKVFGYFISDEPHPATCPRALHDIRQRADFIRAEDPEQKSFMVVMDAERICGTAMGCEYQKLNESLTHVDLIGIDPFPCRIDSGCDPNNIDIEVQRAVDAGIDIKAIVPVFQVFGQNCTSNRTKFYVQPNPAQLSAMLAEWHALVPHPAFDYTYTWRSAGPACPSLDRANHASGVNLQAVMKQHNSG